MFYTPMQFPSHCYSPETFKLKLHFVEVEKENVLSHITLYFLSYLPLTHEVIIPKAVLGSLLVFVMHEVEAWC